jgi:DnaJ-class molecular chaperone
MSEPITCPECHGHGVTVTNPDRGPASADRDCHLCHGSGTATAEDIEAFAQYVESMAS